MKISFDNFDKSVKISCNFSISTCELEQDNPFNVRRFSNNTLLSPDIESPKESDEQGGFYLLKKDSQRRTTLTRVLAQDEKKICDVWMKSIETDVEDTVLSMNHLLVLMKGFRDYFPDQNREIIENAIHILKEELDFDSAAINQLHTAIYLFHNAVNVVLRSHSIKPHWMFALDNLVRNAVQAAITVLSPELGANLAGQERLVQQGSSDIQQEGSTSGMSTINSVKSHKTLDSFPTPKFRSECLEQISTLRAENHRLLKKLVESEKCYQELIKHIIDERTNQTQMLSQLLRFPSDNASNHTTPSADSGLPQINVHQSAAWSLDPKLAEWARSLELDNYTLEKIAWEEYTLDDLLHYVSRDDLRRMNLRGGVELRIWRAINDWRLKNKSPGKQLSIFNHSADGADKQSDSTKL